MPREPPSASAAAMLQSLTEEERAAAFDVLARERLVEEQWRSVRQSVSRDIAIGSTPRQRDLPQARQNSRCRDSGYASGGWPRSAFRPVEQQRSDEPGASEFATGAYGYNTSMPEPRYSYRPSGRASYDDDIMTGGRKRQRQYPSPPRRPKDSPPDSPTSGAESHETSGSGGHVQTRRAVHPRPSASYPSWVGMWSTRTSGPNAGISLSQRPSWTSWSGLSEAAAVLAPPSHQSHGGLSAPPPLRPATQGHGNYRGVSKAADGTRFVAYVIWHGSTNMVGMFDSEKEAAAAHDSALMSMLGEYASTHLNFPQGGAFESAHGPRGYREPVPETGLGEAFGSSKISPHTESGSGSQMTHQGMTHNPNNRQQIRLNKPPASAATETHQKSSQYRGVSWNKKDKKWQSMIFSKGKAIWLGYFKKQDDAARAYDAAAIRERGHKAKLNFADSRDRAESSGPGSVAANNNNEFTPAP